jgi:uncharacterized repeat protein (TIGR03803 family)
MNKKSYFGIFLLLSIVAVTGTCWSQPSEQIIYTFRNRLDGGYPNSGLTMDAAGNLYGAAETGGITGHGTVFELTPNGAGGWTETVLYNIGVNVLDGIQPLGGVVFDSQGNLYGTTSSGGSLGYGTIYKLSPTANGWTETGVYPFNGANGANPNATLTVDSADNVYGTAGFGGPHGKGVVFELVGTNIHILHGFSGGNDGAVPLSTLALDSAGHLYGTTAGGGTDGAGVVFQLTLVNGSWKEAVLYSFVTGAGIGGAPMGGVTLDSSGNVYGTACGNGAAGTTGGVFKLTRISSGKWKSSILYTFEGPTDGYCPGASLVFDTTGNLYGTTRQGGNRGLGTVFELSPTASGQWDEAFLYSFQGGRDGANPITSAVVLDASGNIYGTTTYGGTADTGVVFEITP